ncbi:GTP-binding protein [Micromonospora sagamiensis]|uniref:ATP-binding protein n=1 Tax=Micromonospora sagamiensis TaxID=47875 RepID=A0A562WQ90_9ACTN|nr:ATP/GTP-binding protein [Micromonospora sagamiensis]TWJ32301.1 hypothetical protein JD81_05876 [Micromonospora sagamiensis]
MSTPVAPAAAVSGQGGLKIALTGPFGVGKTTLVQAVSDIAPLSTEVAVASDDVSHAPGKTTTTVAMDFGRLEVNGVTLFVFGTPGQRRFWFMWDAIVRGAVGAVVLVDVRRLQDSFAHLDYIEHVRLPFVVAVNTFPGARSFAASDIRQALALSGEVPIVELDVRNRDSVRRLLIALVQHLLTRRPGAVRAGGSVSP